MVQDGMTPFSDVTLSNEKDLGDASLERLTKESRLAHEQLNRLSRDDHGSLQAKLDMGNVKHLLSDLRYKFSGRQQDVENLIEAEVKARTEDLYRKAHFDALTHLPNRGYFHDMMEQMVQRATETETSFTLLFMDLDGFKKVNDTLGHHIGDDLLRHVSARLVSSLRENDIVARLGGDEFVALLTDSEDDRETIESICKRIISEISRLYYFDGHEVQISTSIGVSRFPHDGRIASELSEHADKALYVAKKMGKKQFRFYEDAETSSDFLVEQRQSERCLALEKAVHNNELIGCVQPQIDLKENRIVGGCLSIAWDNPFYETFSANEWAEQVELMPWADTAANWLLDTACHYLKDWQAMDPEFVVTLPVLRPLWNASLLPKLEEAVARYGIPKNQLQLSFSLKGLQEVGEPMKAMLRNLTEKGYQLTLAGIGAQPLDLNLLSGLSIQEFRFDSEWLHEQMTSEQGMQWVKAIIQMVQSLDACMIASGIDSEQQAQSLKQWGCAYGQGAYWSKMIEVEDFKQLIA